MALRSKRRGPGLLVVFTFCRLLGLPELCGRSRPFVAFQAAARSGAKIARHQVAKDISPVTLLPPSEVSRINAAVRTKALEAIAVGNLPPGKELELISALDLGTIPWNQLPVQLKEHLSLPLEDRGIDSLSLNLSVAVQAKDYANGSTVPLSRLATFHLLVEGKFSKLKGLVQQMIVATSEGTQLPKLWHLSGATHKAYSAEEIEAWRRIAQDASLTPDNFLTSARTYSKRWPHQQECLKHCCNFLQNNSKNARRDFFVQMATGTGKSLVMADVLAQLSPTQRACVIVPKLDLMEQMAQLLEEFLPSHQICRVGTGWPASLSADTFVCVRNSAWQLANLNFDLVLLDEGHHYEPWPKSADHQVPAAANNVEDCSPVVMTHTQQVLALKAKKRIFFTATLRRNLPDFDFGLRPAIDAGVIQDYSVMVPVLSEGDPRPGLVELIRNLPLCQKILAFCNTVHEAQAFTKMLSQAGIAADHYNGGTKSIQRHDILQSFQQPESHGGIRVLVTVDVLSEGVDLPVADTCLFVAPRQGIRMRQCVGRVLRKHPTKVDALVIAPPIVKRANGSLTEEAELKRLLSELAVADSWFRESLQGGRTDQSRLSISTAGIVSDDQEGLLGQQAAQVLQVYVMPHVLDSCFASWSWDKAYQELVAFEGQYGHAHVPTRFSVLSGFKLGHWVRKQREAKRSNVLTGEQKQRLTDLGFVWDVRQFMWKSAKLRLAAYVTKHGHALVPQDYTGPDDFRLGRWVNKQRTARSKGTLEKEQIAELDKHGFVWDAKKFARDAAVERLKAYKAKHGHVLVPRDFKSPDGFWLGGWVNNQRTARSKGTLEKEQIAELDKHGFVWDANKFARDAAVERLKAYKAKHGHVLVPRDFKSPDGFWLGGWVNQQRVARSKGTIEKEQIAELDKHGFVWDANKFARDSAVERLKAYKAKHGHVLVPVSFKAADGFWLGGWVNKQRTARSKGTLEKEQIAELDKHGFVWDANKFARDAAMERLKAYKAKHGHVLVPVSFKAADGFWLGGWVNKQRTARSKGTLEKEQIAELDKHGFVWDAKKFARDAAVERLKAYKAKHGHVLVPRDFKSPDGFWLGGWVNNQRTARAKGRLSVKRIQELKEYDFIWDPKMPVQNRGAQIKRSTAVGLRSIFSVKHSQHIYVDHGRL